MITPLPRMRPDTPPDPLSAAWVEAIMTDDPTQARAMVDAGHDPAIKLGQAMTPAMLCALNGKTQFLRALAEAAPGTLDLDAVSIGGSSAIAIAAMVDGIETLDLLVELGANIENPATHTPCMIAAQGGSLLCLARLLELGANISTRGPQGSTPLMLAAEKGQAQAVQFLVDARASLSATNDQGHQPIHGAASFAPPAPSAAAAEALIRAHLAQGLSIDTRSKAGATALMIAAQRGKWSIIQAFLDGGADPRALDGQGNDAAYHARFSGHIATAEKLVHHAHALDAAATRDELDSATLPGGASKPRPRV